MDFHHLLLAGLPAHCFKFRFVSSPRVGPMSWRRHWCRTRLSACSNGERRRGLRLGRYRAGFLRCLGFPRKPSAHVPARAMHGTAIRDTPEPLAKTATHLGFADQSHMTRSVKQLTGMGSRGGAWLQMDSRRRRKRLCRMYYAPLCPPLSLHFFSLNNAFAQSSEGRFTSNRSLCGSSTQIF